MDDSGLPTQIRLTVVGRRAIDFLLRLDDEGGEHFTRPEFLGGLIAQSPGLQNQIMILYGITFILGSLTLAGGLPSEATVELFGVSMPLSALSQQALAALSAGLFAYYTIKLLNFSALTSLIGMLSLRLGHQKFEYYIADRDASMLWMAISRPVQTEYDSLKIEHYFSKLLMGVSIFTVAVHATMVILGAGAALNSALINGSFVGSCLSAVSLFIVVFCVAAYALTGLIPFTYHRITPDAEPRND